MIKDPEDPGLNRKREEKEYHNIVRSDGLRSSGKFEYFTSNKKWYSVTGSSTKFVEDWILKNCAGKRVLDYCCGNGRMSSYISRSGAKETVGIDISDVSVDNARKSADRDGLKNNVGFYVMDAEGMAFEDKCFDVIYESGVLHHLDINKAFSELSRVLKTDGQMICVEALGHNPIIQRYRKKTPHLRTRWETEHIFHRKEIEFAGNYFGKVEILGFFHLAVLAAVPLRNKFLFKPVLGLLELADLVLMKLPLIKWQAWQVIFRLAEPKK